jgi:hypothetical protein
MNRVLFANCYLEGSEDPEGQQIVLLPGKARRGTLREASIEEGTHVVQPRADQCMVVAQGRC